MDQGKFFDGVRQSPFGGSLSATQVSGLQAIVARAATLEVPLEHLAYCLATAFHETGKTMQPVEEIGKGRGKAYGKPGPHGGQVAYGRGYVQLTWAKNYALADAKLGLGGALIRDYSVALQAGVAAAIMFRGMTEGWFTGKSLRQYLNSSKKDYVGARRIINGTDRAEAIAEYARAFEAALRAAGYAVDAGLPKPPLPKGIVAGPALAAGVAAVAVAAPHSESWLAWLRSFF